MACISWAKKYWSMWSAVVLCAVGDQDALVEVWVVGQNQLLLKRQL